LELAKSSQERTSGFGGRQLRRGLSASATRSIFAINGSPPAGRERGSLDTAENMVDTNTPPPVRVRAADSVLDHAKQAIEIEDIDVRVAALEQAAELSKSSGRSG